MNYDRVAFADVSEQCFELRALGVLAAALISKYLVWRFSLDVLNLLILGSENMKLPGQQVKNLRPLAVAADAMGFDRYVEGL